MFTLKIDTPNIHSIDIQNDRDQPAHKLNETINHNIVEENCAEIFAIFTSSTLATHNNTQIFFNTLLSVTFPFLLYRYCNTLYNTRLVCVTRDGLLNERITHLARTASCVTFTSAAKHDLVIIKLSTDRKDFPTRSSPTTLLSNFCFRSKICDDTRKAKKQRGRPSCHTCTQRETVCDD